jgi:hypothetical protein
MVYAPYYLSKIRKILNSETHAAPKDCGTVYGPPDLIPTLQFWHRADVFSDVMLRMSLGKYFPRVWRVVVPPPSESAKPNDKAQYPRWHKTFSTHVRMLNVRFYSCFLKCSEQPTTISLNSMKQLACIMTGPYVHCEVGNEVLNVI